MFTVQHCMQQLAHGHYSFAMLCRYQYIFLRLMSCPHKQANRHLFIMKSCQKKMPTLQDCNLCNRRLITDSLQPLRKSDILSRMERYKNPKTIFFILKSHLVTIMGKKGCLKAINLHSHNNKREIFRKTKRYTAFHHAFTYSIRFSSYRRRTSKVEAN